ncbi:hypothetical protein [Natronospora cellulosivora (SeqCode)]
MKISETNKELFKKVFGRKIEELDILFIKETEPENNETIGQAIKKTGEENQDFSYLIKLLLDVHRQAKY